MVINDLITSDLMEINNKSIAKLLREAAACYKIKNERSYRFQIIAYERAAETIESLTSEVKDLWKEGKLTEIPGVGPSIQDYIDQLFKFGFVKHIDDLKKNLPGGMFALLDVPGFGAKTAYKLALEFKIENPDTAVEEIEKVAKNHKIAPLEGFGEKSEEVITQNLKRFREISSRAYRMPLPFASEIAGRVVDHLKKLPFTAVVEPLGSLRREVATIGDIDIAVATVKPKETLDWFVKYPRTKRILEKGQSTASIIVDTGAQVDLMVQPPASFGSLLQHFTGSKNHNIKLREYAISKKMSLSEYGIKINGKLQKYSKEKDFYRALGMQWIPPELRENTGEVEASLNNSLPHLIELKDVKGDLQIHSNYNIEPSHDLGVNSFSEIVQKAKVLGYSYVGFSEHNPSISKHTTTDIINILKRRKETIEQEKSSTKSVQIISLLEVDILPDGSLAVPDKGMEHLDACLVSIHTSMEMSKEQMTERVLKALQNPFAKILAHPTGRIIGQRIGFELDWDKVFALALKLDKAIEINAAPQRLDLPDILVRYAIKKGVKLIINTDAHEISGMDMMPYGISVARRGWATKDDIINTMPYNELIKWLHKRN